MKSSSISSTWIYPHAVVYYVVSHEDVQRIVHDRIPPNASNDIVLSHEDVQRMVMTECHRTHQIPLPVD